MLSTCRALVFAILAASASVAFGAKVVVGQVGPMTGPEATQGRGYAIGMEMHFAQVNRAGGVNGHTFALVRRDDAGRPADTLEQTRSLLAEDKPHLLTGFFGTANLGEILQADLLAKEGIALVGYRTSGLPPTAPFLYNARAGLRDEIDKIVNHLATIGIVRLGLLYEATPEGTAIVGAMDEAAVRENAVVVSRASYPPGSTKVEAAAVALARAKAQAIVIVATGAATAAFIESYQQEGGRAQLFAHSGADIEQISKRLSEEQMHGLGIAQVVPSPYKISVRLAREFNDLVARTPNLDVPPSYAMMEGYIVARLIVEVVRRTGRPERAALAAALENLGFADLGGYVVDFKPGKRNGSRMVELSIVNRAGRIRQ